MRPFQPLNRLTSHMMSLLTQKVSSYVNPPITMVPYLTASVVRQLTKPIIGQPFWALDSTLNKAFWSDYPRHTRRFCKSIPVPTELPMVNRYQVARAMADAILDYANGLLPNLLVCPQLQLSFLPMCRYQLQHQLVNHEIPALYHWFRHYSEMIATRKPSKRPLYINHTTVPTPYIKAFITQCDLPEPLQAIVHQSPNTPAEIHKRIKGLLKGQTLPTVTPGQVGGTMAIISSQHYLNVLTPILHSLSQTQALTLVLTDPGIKIDSALLDRLRLNNEVTVVSNDLKPMDTDWLAAKSFLKQLLNRVDSIPSPSDRALILNLLDPLWVSIKNTLSFEVLMQGYRPKLVLGCSEYTMFSHIQTVLQPKYSFKTLNVQHGNMDPPYTLDTVSFDSFFVWNEQTRHIVEQDGFQPMENVHIVGNPQWEALANDCKNTKPSPLYQDLLTWKGADSVIGAFAQYLDVNHSEADRNTYLGTLLHYVKNNPNVKLLIKPHPSEKAMAGIQRYIESYNLGKRVRLLSPTALSLWETIKIIDIATSVFSTTLIDALSLKKPVVALDFYHLLEEVHVDIHDLAWVAHSAEETYEIFTDLLADSPIEKHLNRFDDHRDAWNELFPNFSQPYTYRIESQLAVLLGLPKPIEVIPEPEPEPELEPDSDEAAPPDTPEADAENPPPDTNDDTSEETADATELANEATAEAPATPAS